MSKKSTSPSSFDHNAIHQVLSPIMVEMAEVRWTALIGTNGLIAGSEPKRLPVDEDRVSAMSVAIYSLGERISNELEDGDLKYVLIAGKLQKTMVVHLDKRYVLSLGLHPNTQIDGLLNALKQELLAPLIELLEIDGHPLH